MPVTLAKLAANTAEVKLAVGDDTVTITYFPARINEQVYADLSLLADPTNRDVAANVGALNDTLVKLVKSWDVLEDDGVTMFPVSAERLSELPLVFRAEVINAIFADMRPNSAATEATQNSSPSVAGSSSMA
jgi:hypothetical protein